ncbi:MAG TPA: RusA family crossover junction endodeoxyribonuclease [Thermoanaerobaculia bacterium]|jgi:crossover junction endodeoxyribonuclease RusA
MLPFELTVEGPPVSQQTRWREGLRTWRATVRTAAEGFWPADSDPLEQELSLTIAYFYEGVPLDVDNIIKPIVDSLKGLVYQDDAQITDLVSRRRPLAGPFSIDVISPILGEALSRGQEFLYVRIAEPPEEGGLIF